MERQSTIGEGRPQTEQCYSYIVPHFTGKLGIIWSFYLWSFCCPWTQKLQVIDRQDLKDEKVFKLSVLPAPHLCLRKILTIAICMSIASLVCLSFSTGKFVVCLLSAAATCYWFFTARITSHGHCTTVVFKVEGYASLETRTQVYTRLAWLSSSWIARRLGPQVRFQKGLQTKHIRQESRIPRYFGPAVWLSNDFRAEGILQEYIDAPSITPERWAKLCKDERRRVFDELLDIQMTLSQIDVKHNDENWANILVGGEKDANVYLIDFEQATVAYTSSWKTPYWNIIACLTIIGDLTGVGAYSGDVDQVDE